jgi:hypothetical protein
MFAMPMHKIAQRIKDRVARTHNMPEDMKNAEIEAELEAGWQEIMGKAEKYVQGRFVLENGGWFSTMSLGNWVTLCEAAGVEMIPTRFATTLNPVMVFDMTMNGFSEKWLPDLQKITGDIQSIQDDEILRFDTSAPTEVKSVMTLGRDSGAVPAWKGYSRNDAGVAFPILQDERLSNLVMENPENSSPVWIRKWVEPVMMKGDRDVGYQSAVMPADRMPEGQTLPEGAGDLFPCEWRVYVKNGKISAISNYYTSIARGETAEDEVIALEMARQCRMATEALLAKIDEVGAIPHHPMYEHRDDFDADAVHFSLDFIEARDDAAPMGRRLMMIEGGPAHLRNPNWGAHPTCFGVNLDPEGLALSINDIRPLSALD